MDDARTRGCLSMENGEAAVLLAAGRDLGVPAGALFQPYIDLTEGWDPDRVGEAYRATCRLQADVVLDAALRLRDGGVIPADASPSPGEPARTA
jgi:hypothetical protein